MEKKIEKEVIELIAQGKNVEALNLINEEDEASLYYKSLALFNLEKFQACLLNIEKGMEISKTFYYQFTLLRAKCFVRLDMKKDALKLLEEELSMPYIPKEFLDDIKEMYETLTKDLRSSNNSYSAFDLLNEDELKDELLKMNSKNLIFLIEQLSKRNVRNYMNEVKTLLVSNISSLNKSIILETLLNQGINEEIIVKKNDLEFNVIPSNLVPFCDRPSFKNVQKICEDLNEDKNISFSNDMVVLLFQYLGDIYPLDIDEDEERIVAVAIYVVTNSLFGYKVDITKYGINEKILQHYIDIITKINNTFMC